MKKYLNKAVAATFVAATVVLAGGLTSCKGRTMENMEPTGETVEVTMAQDTVVTRAEAVDSVGQQGELILRETDVEMAKPEDR